MTLEELARRVPKVELHCHLEGTLRTETVGHLARKHEVVLPAPASELYQHESFEQFIAMYVLVGRLLIDEDDFARAAYETLTDDAAAGNLRYREMFFSPTDHFAVGVGYTTMVDGLIAGLEAAKADAGVDCRLIPSINRSESPAIAEDMVRQVTAHPREAVIGIGLDNHEGLGPPASFQEAYRLAGRAGLKRTAHACEDYQTPVKAPPSNVLTCLDLLGCDRIDHGYHLMADTSAAEVCRARGVPFTACVHTSAQARRRQRLANIRAMVDHGLNVTLNSDDPKMFGIDIGQTFVTACDELGYGRDDIVRFCLAGIDASWLSDDDKRSLRASFTREIHELEQARSPAG